MQFKKHVCLYDLRLFFGYTQKYITIDVPNPSNKLINRAMTQIITCLTNEYIIQAADTRLSYADGKRDEKGIKMLGFHYGATFAFTGIAKYGEKRTDRWLLKLMESSNTFEEALMHIHRDAPAYIRGIPATDSRLAIVAATFIRSDDSPLHVPVLFVISNFHDRECRQMAKASPGFGRLDHVFDMHSPVEFPWAIVDPNFRTVN